MARKSILWFLMVVFCTVVLSAGDLQTVPEKTGYQETSRYADVIRFINVLKKRNPDRMHIRYFVTSTEGRRIPLVILSRDGIATPARAFVLDKPAVLIQANIHAGEVEGKEATLMLMREILAGGRLDLLNNQTVLIIPIFNADGNEKMSETNRRDNGPPRAGERKNGQGYDLNRDFIKLDSVEVPALIEEVFNRWDPILFVDMHTTNGSYHREPVTYAPQTTGEGDQRLVTYMWEKALPEMDRILLEKYGVDSIPYGNFDRRAENYTEKWVNHTAEARYSNCYYGLRNRFAILNENYSHADFKSRVLGSLGFIKAILEYTSTHMREMMDLAREADLSCIHDLAHSDFPVRFEPVKTYDFTIKSYVFEKVKILESERDRYPARWYGDYRIRKTDREKDYETALYASFKATEVVRLPAGYILLPAAREAALHLCRHGIRVQQVEEECRIPVRRYQLQELKSAARPFQGHFAHESITFEEEEVEVSVPAGAYYVSLRQPLSRLAAYMLEPRSRDGLLVWNFFDHMIIRQWWGPGTYPVYKVKTPPLAAMHDLTP